LSECKFDEVLEILSKQCDVKEPHNVADARVFESKTLLQCHFCRPRKFRSKPLIGIDLQGTKSCADVALCDGGEAKPLAEAAAQKGGLCQLEIAAQSEYGFACAGAVHGKMLVARASR